MGKDTIYYSVPQFSFTDQDSLQFNSDELKSKPYIIYFFFTSCPSVCPRMTQSAKRIQSALGTDSSEYNIVGISIDPERDLPSKMKKFAQEYDADENNWHFLTGDEQEINDLGIKGLYVGITKSEDEPGGFLHSEKLILVDKDGHLRGYYTGTDADEVKLLIRDMKSLING
ncbi:MAG: SCO family protein [Saprospiraceae bacterium]